MNYLKQIPHKLAIIWCFVMRRPHSITFFPLRHVPLRHNLFRYGVESSNSVTKYFVTEWNIFTPSPGTRGSMNVFDQLLTMFNAKITDSIMREAWLCIVSVLIEYVYVITFLVRYHGLDYGPVYLYQPTGHVLVQVRGN